MPVEWISKEVRFKAKLDYELEVFPIIEDHLVVWHKSKQECSWVKYGGSWFIRGQLLAMEKCVPDFVPSRRVIQKVVVWMRLFGLPLEYWQPMAILEIAAEARRPLAIDEFIDHLKKTGYARVRVEIDASKPLKLEIVIRGRKGTFWQPFIYENLPGVCFMWKNGARG